jgi:hypothetical protein
VKSVFNEEPITENFPVVNIPMPPCGGWVGAVKAHVVKGDLHPMGSPLPPKRWPEY